MSQGGLEGVEGVSVTALLKLDQAKAVERFRIIRLDFQGGFVIAFGQVSVVSAKLSGSKLHPAIWRIGLNVGVAGQLLDGGFRSFSIACSTEKLPGSIFTVAREIEALGVQALPVQVDVRHEEQINC